MELICSKLKVQEAKINQLKEDNWYLINKLENKCYPMRYIVTN